MLPRERFGPTELLRWLEDTQDSNERAKRSHAKRRAAMRASPHIPASAGNRPYLRVHPLVAGTQQHGRAPPQLEQTDSKDVTEGHAKGQKAEGAGRADTRTGRSQEGGTPSIRPEEGTDPGAEGAAKPHCPGEAQRGQIPRNSDGNPDSPQAVVFLTPIIDVLFGY